jgi:hypothetical protein
LIFFSISFNQKTKILISNQYTTRTIEAVERTRKTPKTRTNENGQRIKGSTDT